MSYRTLMVHLELNADNDGLLQVTGDLAERFDAKVIGIAACQPIQGLFHEGSFSDDVMTQDRAEITSALAAAEAKFRSALTGRAQHLQWRSVITYAPLADYIAEEARAADLIITGKPLGAKLMDGRQRVHLSDLAMRVGRPILLVPHGIKSLSLRHVFVGWKESREARRAAADALPILKAATAATVLEICSQSQQASAQKHVDDVAVWLGEHKVSATPQAVVASGSEISFLHAILLDRKCDLFVAGAYGHNRLSEWVFGGVTQEVLLNPDFCVLISH